MSFKINHLRFVNAFTPFLVSFTLKHAFLWIFYSFIKKMYLLLLFINLTVMRFISLSHLLTLNLNINAKFVFLSSFSVNNKLLPLGRSRFWNQSTECGATNHFRPSKSIRNCLYTNSFKQNENRWNYYCKLLTPSCFTNEMLL